MRLKHIAVRNILPVRNFDVDDLSDVVVLAGPNGVGKTRLVDGLLRYFQAPSPGGNVKLIMEATSDAERLQWGKGTLDTNIEADCRTLRSTLQQNRSRTRWISSVINFESDRTIQQITPFNFAWDFQDPWDEMLGWQFGFGRLRERFQDTLHALFRKVRTRREEIAKKAELLMQEKAGLERTIWGVEFYMLCDRDAVPRSCTDTDIEGAAAGRLKVLKRYHLENYFQ